VLTPDGLPLEARRDVDSPVVAPCVVLEPWAPRAVPSAPVSGVRGFLDGIQRSRVVAHRDGVPLVVATVAAAIRQRPARTLEAWEAPLVARWLLLSRQALVGAGEGGARAWEALVATGVPLRDTTDGVEPEAVPLHPRALQARALECVALERERLVADLGQDGELITRISPLEQAARIRAPVLLAWGEEDRRTPPHHAESMRDALTRAGHPPQAVGYAGEGHSWLQAATRVDFAQRTIGRRLQLQGLSMNHQPQS
jgi:pimeloyl-ACP methyl ester carboxylesterase